MLIKKNVALAPYTSFMIGGPAKYFVRIKSEADLEEALDFVKKAKIALHVLGSGSNLLVSDKGYNGLVIKNEIKKFDSSPKERHVMVEVGGGEDWPSVVEKTVNGGWSGIESLAGIPGTTGAAAVQNIGAYGQSLSDVLIDVRAYDLRTGKFVTICAKDCSLAYRTSLFKKNPKRYVITLIRLKLSKTASKKNYYADNRFSIDNELKRNKQVWTPKNVSRAVIKIRQKKGMVFLPGKKRFKSVGSFFVAPIVSKKKFEKIKKRAQDLDQQKTKELLPWFWTAGRGRIKIAPAFLLEFTRYHKGYTEGRVGISALHSLALVNKGGAKARDIVRLARKMQRAVDKKFGVWLCPEVRLLGFKKNPFAKK